jgi:release factor glutamine methyltransferase
MPPESDAQQPWTIRRLLEWTAPFFERKDVDSPRLSAELLLSHVLGTARIQLYTNYDRELSAKDLATFRELVRRASEQEPIAYLTGKAHFFNLEFDVTPDVLIPRPDSETVVENVLQLARHQTGFEAPRVLDLCTGSGNIAAAIAHHLKTAIVVATDVSEKAIAVARRNIDRLSLADRVTLEVGDLYDPLSHVVDARPFDLITANPPYIATAKVAQLDRSVKDYEPMIALDGGIDGLVAFRAILEGAPSRLRSGGRFFVEIAYDEGEAALAIARKQEVFEETRVLKDHAGNDRVVTGKRK